MKRTLCLLLALLMLASCVSALATSGECKHKWAIDPGVDATCTEPGEYWEYCEICGEGHQVTVKPKGHYYPNPYEVVTAPTCTTVGYELSVCQRNNHGRICGHQDYRQIPALGHDWSEWYVIKPATPEEDGIEERKCNRCGITEQRTFGYDPLKIGLITLTVAITDDNFSYDADQTVHMTATVTNAGPIPLKITEILTRGSEMYGESVQKTLEPAQSLTVPMTYLTTTEDAEKGYRQLVYFARAVPVGYEDDEKYILSNDAPVTFNLVAFADYDLIVNKTETSTPANGEYYVEGETITYNIEIINRFAQPIHDVEVYEMPGGSFGDGAYTVNIGNLPPYGSTNLSATYEVTKQDCVRGFFINSAYAGNEKHTGTTSYVTSPCGEKAIVSLVKTETSTPENGKYYVRGEVIHYQIVLINAGSEPLTEVNVHDDYLNEETELCANGSLKGNNASMTFNVTYTVTEEDTLMGYHMNIASASFKGGKELCGVQYTDSNIVISKCGYDENALHLDAYIDSRSGDDLTFRCELTNNSTQPVCPEYVWYVTPSSKSTGINDPTGGAYLAPGETYTYTMEYTIAAEDVVDYEVELLFGARCHPQDDPDEELYSNMAEVRFSVDEEIGDTEIWIEKTETSVPANGEYYTEGEVITYTITIWNLQSYALTHVQVHDYPGFQEEGEEVGVLPTFPAHASQSYPYSHTVTHDDVENGFFQNRAMVFWNSPNDDLEDPEHETNWMDAEPVESLCGEQKEKVTITKIMLSVPQNGIYYMVGEVVYYKVTVINQSNQEITIQVFDSLIGDLSGGYATLAPGEVIEYPYSYLVTQADALMGMIINTASVIYTDESGKVVGPIWSQTVLAPTGIVVDEQGGVTLTKSVVSVPADGVAYTKGEMVIYEVTITNNLPTPVEDVEIVDPIKGNNEDSVVAHIEKLDSSESLSFLYQYRVTEEDVKVGQVINQAYAGYFNPREQENGDTSSNIVSVPVHGSVIPEYPQVSIYKEEISSPANGKFYVEGETVSFAIWVTNDSDFPISSVQISDIVSTYTNGNVSYPIKDLDILGPGESTEKLTFNYTVTAGDVSDGCIMDNAFVAFVWARSDRSQESEGYYSDTVIVLTGKEEDTDEPVIDVALTKTIVNAPADGMAYGKGETISYLITLVNASDVTVYVTKATDDLYNLYSGQTTDLGLYAVEANSSLVLSYTHTVDEDDIKTNWVANYVEMTLRVELGEGKERYYTLWDEVFASCADTIPPEERLYPVVYKFVTSHPANNSYYQLGEKIEYDIIVVNPADRPFTNLVGNDILLTDSYFVYGPLGDLAPSGGTQSFHIKYTVTQPDVDYKSVYNIAWIDMYDAEYDEMLTFYSNDVIVPTDGTIVHHDNGGDVCDYTLVAAGEGVEEYMNVYCAEHEGINAASKMLLDKDGTEEEKRLFSARALDIWKKALDSEYDRLIEDADDVLKQALEDDRLVFGKYLEAYGERLKMQGTEERAINEALIALIRDRVCELCYTAGTAPEDRKDLPRGEEMSAKRPASPVCFVSFDDGNDAYFTKSMVVCNRHLPLIGAISRILTQAGEDEKLRLIALDKESAYFTGEIKNEYAFLTKNAEPLLRHTLTVEEAAYLALVKAHTALYRVYYPDAERTIALLNNRMLKEKALDLCN